MAYLANAPFDAHRDDPEFGYRFLADEARYAGHSTCNRTMWREHADLGERWPESGFVFTTAIGTPIDPDNCGEVVRAAMKSAGVRVVRPHDLRHGCVSVLLGLGVPPRTVMEIAGHSALEMTMNVYGHVTLDDKREALEKLGDLFEEARR